VLTVKFVLQATSKHVKFQRRRIIQVIPTAIIELHDHIQIVDAPAVDEHPQCPREGERLAIVRTFENCVGRPDWIWLPCYIRDPWLVSALIRSD
jgi:hypothetical protein